MSSRIDDEAAREKNRLLHAERRRRLLFEEEQKKSPPPPLVNKEVVVLVNNTRGFGGRINLSLSLSPYYTSLSFARSVLCVSTSGAITFRPFLCLGFIRWYI